MEHGPLAERRDAVGLLDVQLEPRQPGQAHLGPQAQQACPARSPRPARSRRRRPRRAAAGRGVRGAAPDRPTSRSSSPRTCHARPQEYHPRSPPTLSSTRPQVASGAARTTVRRARRRRAIRRPSPGRWAGGRSAPRRPTPSDHRVVDVGVVDPAQRELDRAVEADSPSGGSGTYAAMSCSSHTTSCTSDSTSGRASPDGTGVTSPTHRLDSRGESTGHRDDDAPRQPGDLRVPLHHLPVGEDLRPADVERRGSRPRGSRAAPTR